MKLNPPGILLCLFLLVTGIPFELHAEENHYQWVLENSAAPWQARDSQGELVFQDQIWLFGGWFNSFEAPPRDVWSSKDGKTWNLIEKNAPWIHSDLPMSVTFKDQMWMMGGWYNGRLDGHSASNQVWSSTDGKKLETGDFLCSVDTSCSFRNCEFQRPHVDSWWYGKLLFRDRPSS